MRAMLFPSGTWSSAPMKRRRASRLGWQRWATRRGRLGSATCPRCPSRKWVHSGGHLGTTTGTTTTTTTTTTTGITGSPRMPRRASRQRQGWSPRHRLQRPPLSGGTTTGITIAVTTTTTTITMITTTTTMITTTKTAATTTTTTTTTTIGTIGMLRLVRQERALLAHQRKLAGTVGSSAFKAHQFFACVVPSSTSNERTVLRIQFLCLATARATTDI
mmetsp:Transcript_88442/g.253336  ORF Transcript_88442/g.253336 Transcript_88442/m.253336 type:complete len:218 (-) Transcript_88442:189-842(-)